MCLLSESGQDVGSTYKTNKAGTIFSAYFAEDARNKIRDEIYQAKLIDVGSTYRTNKADTIFSAYFAEDARNKIRDEIYQAKLISVMTDGTTDCSYQEAEIIFI